MSRVPYNSGVQDIEEQSPSYEQGGPFTFELSKTITTGDGEVTLAADMPVTGVRNICMMFGASVASSTSDVTFRFKHSADNGVTWKPVTDASATALTFVFSAVGATAVGASVPGLAVKDVTGGLLRVTAQTATQTAVVSAQAGWGV